MTGTQKGLYDWFHAAACAFPAREALRTATESFSYADLVRLVGATAGRLASAVPHDRGRPPRIGILGARDAASHIAYLGCLRLGATAVALHADAPTTRNAGVARIAGLDLLLHATEQTEQATAIGTAAGVRTLSTQDVVSDQETAPGAPVEVDPDAFAYIVFTSGSTGTPKGVPIRHRNLAAWLPQVLHRYAADCVPRMSQTSELSWDLSVFTMFVAWGAGGTVVVPSRTDLLSPVDHVVANDITHWFLTPSATTMALRLGEVNPGAMPGLRWSLFCGEPLTPDLVDAWRAGAPNSRVANVYGPTEVTVTSVVYDLPTNPADWPRTCNGTFPIGTPHPSVEWAVVDEGGREAEDGELLLRGPQRFDGYLDPAHDEGRFSNWNGDGRPDTGAAALPAPELWFRTGDRVRREADQLVFLGRLDDQVKVRGHRVELRDVEAAVREHPGIIDAAVVAFDADGITELAVFVVGQRTAAITEHAVRDGVGTRLPPYMVPRLVLPVESLPLNTNGKVDRQALATSAASAWQAPFVGR